MADVVGAFSEEHAAELGGVSRAVLRRWAHMGLLTPSFGAASGLPFGRIYSFRDLVSVRVLHQLRNRFGIPYWHLQEVLEELSQLSAAPWADTTLHVRGRRVVVGGRGSSPRHEVGTGQQMLDLPLRVVIGNLRDAVTRLNDRAPEQVGQVVQARFVAQNQPVLSGTRIPVALIASYIRAGYSAAAVVKEFPDLTSGDVEAVRAQEREGAA